jgi:hypothetical protein
VVTGAPLTDEERAQLKAREIARLRQQAAEFERSEEIHRYRERGQVQMTAPSKRDYYNDAMRVRTCSIPAAVPWRCVSVCDAPS